MAERFTEDMTTDQTIDADIPQTADTDEGALTQLQIDIEFSGRLADLDALDDRFPDVGQDLEDQDFELRMPSSRQIDTRDTHRPQDLPDTPGKLSTDHLSLDAPFERPFDHPFDRR